MEAQTPEQQLWIATVSLTVQDLEDCYKSIEKSLADGLSAIPQENSLRILKGQIKHDWFSQVCLAADLHVDKILSWIDRREAKVYGRLH